MNISLAKAPPPVLTGRPAIEIPRSLTAPPPLHPSQQQMTEKERFIASMEHGITRTSTYSHRSMTLPAPVHPSTARAAEDKQEESAVALRRQQNFKADLEIQIQEKKRQKALELEKERQWEAEQEARLEKEREELRKEFEAEHAARRAKVEADAAENAAAVSRKATATNASKESNERVQIYAPKRRNITVKKSASPPLHSERTNDNAEQQQKQRAQEPEGNDSSPPSTALDPKELSRKLQEMETKFNKDDESIPCKSTNSARTNLEATAASSSTSAAHTVALTEQVEELKRLNEALQRDLSLHKTVLELVKDNKLAATVQSLQSPPPLQQQQVPVYINPLALGLQPAPVLHTIPFQAALRSLPIVYTASELRTEDSRPPTRMVVTGKQKPPTTTSAANYKIAARDASNDEMIKAVRSVQQQRTRLSGTAAAETMASSQKGSIPQVAKANLPVASSAPTLPPLETARLPPARAAERLGIWKKAKMKLRKLSVAKPTGAKEAVWVVKEESSAAMGPLAVNRTRSLQ
jgi:hypothetical protein